MNLKPLWAKPMTKIVAGLLCLTLIAGSLALALTGTHAAAVPVSFAENPIDFVAEKVTLLDIADGEKSYRTMGAGDYYATSDSIAVDYVNNYFYVTPDIAGRVSLVYCMKTTGKIALQSFWVKDMSNVIEYTLTNGNSVSIAKNGSASVQITAKDGSGNDAASQITWISMNTGIAEVSTSGAITAKNTDGIAILLGSFTDVWGRSQIIAYSVQVGEATTGGVELGDGVLQIGDDFYKPVPGFPGVWEQTDASGESSTGNYVGGNDKLPNPFEPLYEIKPDDNNALPPADKFDNTYPGFLTTMPEGKSEYDQWQSAVEHGVVQVGDDHYKPVLNEEGNPSGVWEKTDPSGESNSDIFVGGTPTTPDPSEPLYKLQPGDSNTDPSADDFSNTYPGYLTTQPEGESEYDQWKTAIIPSEIPDIDIETYRLSMGHDKYNNTLTWQVLEIVPEENKMLVISATVITEWVYHNKLDYPGWGKSLIRNFLNSTVYNNYFIEPERDRILMHDVWTDRSHLNKTPELSQDYIYLLSKDEIEAYWPEESQRIAQPSRGGNITGEYGPSEPSTSWGSNTYWLRNSPSVYTASYVMANGGITNKSLTYGTGAADNNRNQGGVRPVMWIKIVP